MNILSEIVSGGQTGADRAALDWALANRVPHSGWCPAGRLSEDGPISDRYLLSETPTGSYALRTEWNVRDSDATVIFSIGSQLTGGSALTMELARRLRRPVIHISKAKSRNPADTLTDFVDSNFIRKLNVAGPRISTEQEIGIFVEEVLSEAFG